MRKVHACLLLLAILLMPMMGIGENADIAEGVAMWINGEAVYQSQIDSVTASVTESMGLLGLDTSDEEIVSAISKVAQRQVIEDRLLSQDMTSQGMYDLTQEEENEVALAAKETVEEMLAEYTAYYAGLAQEDMNAQTAADKQAQDVKGSGGVYRGFL